MSAAVTPTFDCSVCGTQVVICVPGARIKCGCEKQREQNVITAAIAYVSSLRGDDYMERAKCRWQLERAVTDLPAIVGGAA